MRRSFRRSTGRHAVRRAIGWTGLTAVLLALGACARLMEPSETQTRLSPTAAEVTERDAPFPNLASVPDEPPAVAPPEVRNEIMEGLVADRANAEYTGDVLTAEDGAPSGRAAPLPDIFSIVPAAGPRSEPAATVRRAAPEPPDAAPEARTEAAAETTPGASAAASAGAAPETAPEAGPEAAAVPPSPVPELMPPPAEPQPSPGRAANAEPAAPAALEPGGALGPIVEEPAEVAALPPDEPVPDEPVPDDRGGAASEAGTRILFDGDSAELSAAARTELTALAERLARDDEARVELVAYAGGGESSSHARRLSLSRAIAVRRFLIEQGVSSSRMDVRALGDQAAADTPADRVDVTLARR